MKKRLLSLTMLVAVMLSIIPLSLPVHAKANLPSISKSCPIYTYTYKSSGKIYRYTDSTLKTKESGHWIDCANDQCKIIEIQNEAVKVLYPTSSGEKSGWFVRSEFCKGDLKADQAKYSFTATKQITTFRWKEKNTVYGYISKGDKTYLLRGDQNSNWLQVLYPVSGGYKMAWVKGDDLFASSITLSKTSISKQDLGWSETLKATLSPSNSADSVTWTSSNTSIATVTGSGVVKGVGYGTAVITATTKRGISATCSVSNNQPSVPKHYIDLNCIIDGTEKYDLAGIASVDVYINGSLDVTNAPDYYKEWPEGTRYEIRSIKTNSGYKYEGVKSGNLSGTVGSGNVGIWLMFRKNKTATVPVSGIKLNKSSVYIKAGKTTTLNATISPNNATNKTISWSSSNKKVATVSGGKIKGVSSGKTTITAKSNNGKKATCTVTVGTYNNPKNIPSLSGLSKSEKLAKVGESQVGYQGTNSKGSGKGDNTAYGAFTGSNNAQWCASFVSWCVNKAGVSTKIVPKTASTLVMGQKSNSYKKWNKTNFKNIKRGDVVLFSRTNALTNKNGGKAVHHVGIVVSVNKSKGTLKLVEGNTGQDIVARRDYTVNTSTGKITKSLGGYWNGEYFCGYIAVK